MNEKLFERACYDIGATVVLFVAADLITTGVSSVAKKIKKKVKPETDTEEVETVEA